MGSLVAVGFLFFAPVAVIAQSGGANTGEGELIYGEQLPLNHLNPYASISRNGPTDRVLSIIYEPLFRFNFSDEAWESVLADRYEVVPSSNTVVVHLKPNVVWHDGSAFTSNDVIRTYEYIIHAGANEQLGREMEGLISAMRPDGPNRVVFEFSRAVPDPAIHFSHWILPASRFTDDLEPAPGVPDINNAPVGTGPYKFEAFERGQPTFTLNMEYHGVLGNLERIESRRHTDPSTLVEDLLSNRADGLDMIVEVPPEFLPRIEGEGNRIRISQIESYNVNVVAIRQRDGSFLADERVRRAMTMAIDRQTLLENWFGGYGNVVASPVVPAAPFFDQSVSPLPYDPDEAERLIQEAGAVGMTVRFIYRRAEMNIDTRIHDAVTSISDQLEAVGLRVRLQPLEQHSFRNALHQLGDFDLAWVRWEFNPAYNISDFFHSSQREPGGLNYMNFSDLDVDRALDEYDSATDRNRQQSQMFSLQEMLNQKAPAIFLMSVTNSYAYRSDYVIPPGTVDPFLFFSYVSKWYVFPAL